MTFKYYNIIWWYCDILHTCYSIILSKCCTVVCCGQKSRTATPSRCKGFGERWKRPTGALPLANPQLHGMYNSNLNKLRFPAGAAATPDSPGLDWGLWIFSFLMSRFISDLSCLTYSFRACICLFTCIMANVSSHIWHFLCLIVHVSCLMSHLSCIVFQLTFPIFPVFISCYV